MTFLITFVPMLIFITIIGIIIYTALTYLKRIALALEKLVEKKL